MKLWVIVAVLVACVVTGCVKSTTQPGGGAPVVITPQMQLLVNVGFTGAAGAGCAFIRPQDKATALASLNAVDALLKTDPAKALDYLQQIAGSPGPAQLWTVLHTTLTDPIIVQALAAMGLLDWTEAQWFQLATGGLQSAVNGCRLGLGLSPSAALFHLPGMAPPAMT